MVDQPAVRAACNLYEAVPERLLDELFADDGILEVKTIELN